MLKCVADLSLMAAGLDEDRLRLCVVFFCDGRKDKLLFFWICEVREGRETYPLE